MASAPGPARGASRARPGAGRRCGPGGGSHRGWLDVASATARRHRLAALGATPGELPGLVEARPDVALAFFRKAAEGLRVELREGVPWLSVKERGRPYLGRPYFGGA